MEDGLLSLKWDNHKISFTKAISLYRDQALFADVTLACNGQYFHAHKIILSSCSEYFQEIFSITQCKQPVIVLKDIRPVDIEQLLHYIYMGEVEVKQSELAEFLKVAECLKIKGLTTPDDDAEDEISIENKRKRHLSDDRPESPKKQTTHSLSNTPSDTSLNLQSTSENIQLSELKEIIRTKHEDIEKIDIKSDNSFEKELLNADNEPQNENFDQTITDTPVVYLPESESVPSEGNEMKNVETSKFCIARITGQLTTYYCTACPYNSTERSKFIRHVRVHTGEKPFKCEYCDYGSSQKQAVKKHERIHTGEKPYACSQCSFRTAQKQNLNFHQKTRHPHTS